MSLPPPASSVPRLGSARRRARAWRWSWGWFLLFFAAAHGLRAQGTAGLRPTADYLVQSWFNEQGLPQNAVSCVLRTRDGYLWIGTYNGLARFDGVRFERFGSDRFPGLRTDRITSLWEDLEGSLWVGQETGDIARLPAGARIPEALEDSRATTPIKAIRADGQRDLWILETNGRLVRARDGLTLTLPGGLWPTGRSPPLFTADGELWVLGNNRLFRVTETGVVEWTDPNGAVSLDVRSAGPARAGGLWIVTGQRVRRWQDARWVEDRGPNPAPDMFLSAFYERRNGDLLIGTVDAGLHLMGAQRGAQHVTRAQGLAHDWIHDFTEDYEGNVWVATAGGLCAVRERRVRMIEPTDAWFGRSLLALAPGRDGALWIGTEGAGLYRLTHDGIRRYNQADGIDNLFAWAVTEDAEQRAWVGTWGNGLYVRTGARWARAPGWDAADSIVAALHVARDGRLWVGTASGVAVREGDTWQWFRAADGQPILHVRCLAEDEAGRLWFGTAGNGLGRIEAGRARLFHKDDGLPSEFIWSLLPRGGDALWIGTFGGGLVHWTPAGFATLSTKDGLPDNNLTHLTMDRRGRLWAGTMRGVFAAEEAALLARLRDRTGPPVQPFLLDVTDGLATNECTGGFSPSGWLDAAGQLFLPTRLGLAAIDTTRLVPTTLPLPVVIEEARVDDVAVWRGDHADLVVPPGRHRVDIQFTALGFTAPQRVRFRYTLEGASDEWVEIGTARTLSLNFLPPGRYRLRLMASNQDGLWTNADAALGITVQPYLWQTWWARAAAGLAAAFALGLTVRAIVARRARRRLEEVERRHALERERTRIARDIHDDLGSSLTRIVLLSQHTGSAEDDTSGRLRQILGTAREITRTMDEIVWAVNPHHDTLDSLAAYLSRFAQDFTSAAGLRCRLNVPFSLPPRPLGSDVRHSLFLACKEALNNVVRHAQASAVTLQLQCIEDELIVTVSDDGVGLPPAPEAAVPAAGVVPPRVGNGLANLQRRLEALGGTAELTSQPGRGTTVCFRVPLGTSTPSLPLPPAV